MDLTKSNIKTEDDINSTMSILFSFIDNAKDRLNDVIILNTKHTTTNSVISDFIKKSILNRYIDKYQNGINKQLVKTALTFLCKSVISFKTPIYV